MEIVIQIDSTHRIRLYEEGGLDLEAHVKGIGWVLNNSADFSDSALKVCLTKARDLIARNPMIE